MVGTFLVHGQVISIHELIRFITARTSKSHHLPPYSIFYDSPQRVAPKCHFSRDSQVGNPEILEIEILTTLEPHSFLCRPSIESRFQATL
jgi:hypothetical protein